MSEQAVIDPPETWAATAVPLLREYQQKMESIREQLRALKELAVKRTYDKDTEGIVRAEIGIIKDFYRRFKPAAQDLTRQVSGMIDQGHVTPLERVEMKLRLAEFESFLNELPTLIQAYRF